MAQKENKSKKETKYPLAAYFEYYNQFLDSSIGKALKYPMLLQKYLKVPATEKQYAWIPEQTVTCLI